MTSLAVRAVVRRPEFTLDAGVHTGAGETVALLGPNGAGKSTLLQAIAGLVALDDGEVMVDGVTWEAPARGVRLAPQLRSVGVVFQGYLLFPALSVVDNVAYGLRARGLGREPARRHALEQLERFDIAHLARRRPATLSGGESQRVALARALAVEPDVLLLDEPMAALDVEVRSEARRVLRRALADFGGVKLLVTHEPIEAIALADRLFIMESGRIVQVGTAADLRARPRSRYAASLVGLNFVSGKIVARSGHTFLDTGSGLVALADVGLLEGTRALATIDPRAISLTTQPDRPAGSPRNVLHARVEGIDIIGDRARVALDSRPPLVAEVTAEAVIDLELNVATRLWASVKATSIEVYPA